MTRYISFEERARSLRSAAPEYPNCLSGDETRNQAMEQIEDILFDQLATKGFTAQVIIKYIIMPGGNARYFAEVINSQGFMLQVGYGDTPAQAIDSLYDTYSLAKIAPEEHTDGDSK